MNQNPQLPDPPATPDDLDLDTSAEAAPPEADSEEPLQELYFEIRHDLQKRVDLYLRDRLPAYSRAMIQKLCRAGNITVNGHAAKSSTVIRAGDVVRATLPHAPPEEALPENIPLDIVYEDEHFLAVNKQPGLIVH